MDKVMKELIELDLLTQLQIEEAKVKRLEMKKQIGEDKKKINKQIWDEAKRKVMLRKLAIDEQMKRADVDNQLEYQQALDLLQHSYTEHQQVWLTTIVERCIGDKR